MFPVSLIHQMYKQLDDNETEPTHYKPSVWWTLTGLAIAWFLLWV